MAKSKDKTHQKRVDNNCHIPDLVQAFSNVENVGLTWFYSAKPLTLYDCLIKLRYIYNDA